jgi:hypothetical protein
MYKLKMNSIVLIVCACISCLATHLVQMLLCGAVRFATFDGGDLEFRCLIVLL